jgi:hypothetical protein
VTTKTQDRRRCVVCGSEYRSFEGVSFGNRGEHCFPCFNQATAAQMGITFHQPDLEPVTLSDAGGHPHTFHVRSRLAPTGHVMEAFEVEHGTPRGYRFAVLGDFEADAMTLFTELYDRMRRALAVQHVRKDELGWRIELDHVASGRITADLENDSSVPCVVIDGREFTWEQLGQMLMTYEGFNLELCVRNSIDVVGGPLLDEQ